MNQGWKLGIAIGRVMDVGRCKLNGFRLSSGNSGGPAAVAAAVCPDGWGISAVWRDCRTIVFRYFCGAELQDLFG